MPLAPDNVSEWKEKHMEATLKQTQDAMTINRVEPYETQLEQYIWKLKEKWAMWSFLAGCIVSTVFWLIAIEWGW